MLEFSVTEQPNSIEELFAKEFEGLRKYPMDNETSEIFVKLILSKDSKFEIPDNEKPFLYQLIEKRISVLHDYKLDDRVLLFLSFICKSAGIGVMYCWYMQYESKKRNIELVSFEIFAEIFGCGFPSDDGLQKIWDSQKVDTTNKDRSAFSDNLLDYPKAGLSLFKNYVNEKN
jgi:hypothetical protein